ncbi:hypothetical protein Dsin_021918 [Dipteronia sinensis]|uniref:Major facilitator superfamily (MFS) profile domain-containing protein n=1 Tax=Dipteronia sinensis TaxID=43782 RepID=A0AAE0DZ95_9ROSI|nr:hypothetical protein Dsin_021918 [Dipteronia sinensis]
MADHMRPLLPQTDHESVVNEDPVPLISNCKFWSLDDIIEDNIGDFGWAQLVQCLLVSLARLFDGQQTFITIFTDAEPSWHCSTTSNDVTCTTNSDICQLSNSEWAWDGSSSRTIVSEWNLQCASSIITSLPSSSFFLGSFLGCLFLATLADSSLGRKKLLFLSCLIMSFSALATIFSTNVWIYAILKFLSGFGTASIGTCVLLLLTEKVGKKWRGQLGIMGFFFFSLGYLSLPTIAYMNRDSSWRSLYLYTSIPAIIYCIFVFIFVSESPRWLFLQGREAEAIEILKRIAPIKDRSLKSSLVSHVDIKVETSNSIKCLFVKRWALRRILGVMVLGFGIGMVYYGIPMGVQDLGFNIYLGTMCNALLEMPSYLVTFLVIDRCQRRFSILGFCVASGIFSILCFIVSNYGSNDQEIVIMKIGIEIASLFGACMAYNILLIYTTELFPTSVRNAATSMVRLAIAFSSVVSPVLARAGRRNAILSYGVFGFVIIFCSIFVAFLPATKGATLCDTMNEQEKENDTFVT